MLICVIEGTAVQVEAHPAQAPALQPLQEVPFARYQWVLCCLAVQDILQEILLPLLALPPLLRKIFLLLLLLVTQILLKEISWVWVYGKAGIQPLLPLPRPLLPHLEACCCEVLHTGSRTQQGAVVRVACCCLHVLPGRHRTAVCRVLV